jgi:lipopolysaccharide biosynthesis glycosyltransferase
MSELAEASILEHVGRGLVTHSRLRYQLAWEQFRLVETEMLTRLAPREAVDCAFVENTPESTAVALAIVADPARIGTRDLPALAGRLQVAGHPDVARRLVEEAERRDVAEFDDEALESLANQRRWTHPVVPEPGPEGAVTLGVIDYLSPDTMRASRNLGDYVQTLAMLGNLARFRQTRFHGAEGLGELVTRLQGRIRPELELEGGDGDVHLIPVNRDFSDRDPIPENTWMIAFGWHMHPLFRIRFGLPYHPNVNPVFVSFHLNKPAVLTDEAITYLRAHGPVGCRDWTTVDLLLSAGVDAFFTGCLTTTVNAVFPDREQVEDTRNSVVAVIDLPRTAVKAARRPVEMVTHADPVYRRLGLVEGIEAASELLADYQKRYHRVVTSRLHSYLPATSLGVPVSFQPHVPGDVRFEGLHGMEPHLPAFEQMRDGIRELIALTFSRIMEGAGRDEVYDFWRELTADRVAEAKERFSAPPRPFQTGVDVAGLVAQVRAGQHAWGPHEGVDPARVTDVAVSLDANFKALMPVTLESLVSNASGQLRLWITGRGLDEDYQRWVHQAFPDVPMTFLPYDGVDYGIVGRLIKHITVATMDRLLLPDVLPDLDRITYIDIDTVTEGDVCQLAATDLGGKPLAARTTMFSGSLIWRQAGNHLDADRAAELRRTMSARHPFDFRTINAGVLVLDLARMRADRFVETFVPMAAEYGLNDQDILLAYVGADRQELEPRWNALPVHEAVTDDGVIHYAGAGKPWEEDLVPDGVHWTRYAARLTARVGEVPTTPQATQEG